MEKLSETQKQALKMLSYGVPLNLRLSFTKSTVSSLIHKGLIDQKFERTYEHSITDSGKEVLLSGN